MDKKQYYARLRSDIIRITFGSALYVAGFKLIASSHNFVPAGTYGLALVFSNIIPFAVPVFLLYIGINVPLFIIAKKNVSTKFFFLNLYSMIVVSVLIALIDKNIDVQNTILAAMAAGAIMGIGVGVTYTSSGGGGGFDVIAIIVHRKFGVRLGIFNMVVNAIIMTLAATQVTVDQLIASILMMFVTSVVTEQTLSAFNTRKEMKIISIHHEEIVEKLLKSNIGGTIFDGKGMYSKEPITMVWLIVYNYQMKRVENIVFDIDPNALILVESTFNVIGKSISPRKQY